ncbi:MAG TPA: MBL fold hydrolase, partial [Cytophagales bacterium]|nr:MBL fold hydrolase [Cytophagales bacterium]
CSSDLLLQWLDNFTDSPKFTFITHGETASANTLAEKLKAKGWNVVVPQYLQTFELFDGI